MFLCTSCITLGEATDFALPLFWTLFAYTILHVIYIREIRMMLSPHPSSSSVTSAKRIPGSTYLDPLSKITICAMFRSIEKAIRIHFGQKSGFPEFIGVARSLLGEEKCGMVMVLRSRR